MLLIYSNQLLISISFFTSSLTTIPTVNKLPRPSTTNHFEPFGRCHSSTHFIMFSLLSRIFPNVLPKEDSLRLRRLLLINCRKLDRSIILLSSPLKKLSNLFPKYFHILKIKNAVHPSNK